MEWPDTYNPDNLADLRRFHDRYLKDIRNGWEFTPRARVEVMDAYDYDYIRNKPEKEFPIKRTQYTKLYLNAADQTMSPEPPAVASEVAYSNKTGMAVFSIRFRQDVEIMPEFIKTDWYGDHGMNFYTDNGPESVQHVIHTGGRYPSYLQIPVIPPKYTSGEFKYGG